MACCSCSLVRRWGTLFCRSERNTQNQLNPSALLSSYVTGDMYVIQVHVPGETEVSLADAANASLSRSALQTLALRLIQSEQRKKKVKERESYTKQK